MMTVELAAARSLVHRRAVTGAGARQLGFGLQRIAVRSKSLQHAYAPARVLAITARRASR